MNTDATIRELLIAGQPMRKTVAAIFGKAA